MHDHTLTCLADPAVGSGDGINLEGGYNEVSEGNIEGCGVAVRLEGYGRHRVSKLNVSGDGILVHIAEGGSNVVQDVVASLGLIAFAVAGRDNVLLHNQSLSAATGFVVVGNHNRLTNNSAVSSGCRGYFMSFSGADNVLTDNEGVGNLNDLCDGIFVIEGFRTILERNTARASVNDGFTFSYGGNNVVRNNVATGNAGTGISVLSGVTGNEFVGNIATGNGQDLNDGNPDCDNNIWRDNQFETASACIQMICASGTRSLPVLNSPPAPQPISSAVTISGSAPSPPAGGGGGGAIDWLTLLWLTGLAGMVAARGSASGRRMDPDR
jgi:parallel beta-helix repeat protein